METIDYKEMSIEQLVDINKSLNDKRVKAFKELRKRIKEQMLPALVGVMQASDVPVVFIKLESKPYDGLDAWPSPEDECDYYVLAIYNDGKIKEGKLEADYDRGYKETLEDPGYKREYQDEFVLGDAVNELYVKIRNKIISINKNLEHVVSVSESKLA